MKRVLRRGRVVKDPTTPAEWREAVDGARYCLLLESAFLYGLIEPDPVVDVVRCEEILERGKARRVLPRSDDQIVADYLGSPT